MIYTNQNQLFNLTYMYSIYNMLVCQPKNHFCNNNFYAY